MGSGEADSFIIGEAQQLRQAGCPHVSLKPPFPVPSRAAEQPSKTPSSIFLQAHGLFLYSEHSCRTCDRLAGCLRPVNISSVAHVSAPSAGPRCHVRQRHPRLLLDKRDFPHHILQPAQRNATSEPSITFSFSYLAKVALSFLTKAGCRSAVVKLYSNWQLSTARSKQGESFEQCMHQTTFQPVCKLVVRAAGKEGGRGFFQAARELPSEQKSPGSSPAELQSWAL